MLVSIIHVGILESHLKVAKVGLNMVKVITIINIIIRLSPRNCSFPYNLKVLICYLTLVYYL